MKQINYIVLLTLATFSSMHAADGIEQRRRLAQRMYDYVQERYPQIPLRTAHALGDGGPADRTVLSILDVCLVKKRSLLNCVPCCLVRPQYYDLYMFSLIDHLPYGLGDELSLAQKFLVDIGVLVGHKVIYADKPILVRTKAVLDHLCAQRTTGELAQIRRDLQKVYPADWYNFGWQKLAHETLSARLQQLSGS